MRARKEPADRAERYGGMRYFLVIAAALSVAACSATPQAKIADTLVGFGIDRPRAECVGGYLQSNLSPAQLLELARVAKSAQENDPDPAKLTSADLLRVSSEIKDPQIPLTVARAAGKCGIVPAPFAILQGL